MSAFILLIVINGWGTGVGSTGNMASSAEFTTKERCEAAAQATLKALGKIRGYHSGAEWAECFPK